MLLADLQPQTEEQARTLGEQIAQNYRAAAAFQRLAAIEDRSHRIAALDAAYMISTEDRYSEACYLLWLVAEEYHHSPKDKEFAAKEYARVAGLALARGAVGPDHVEEILLQLGNKAEYQLAALQGALHNSPKDSPQREACKKLLDYAKKQKYKDGCLPPVSQWLGAAMEGVLPRDLALARFDQLSSSLLLTSQSQVAIPA